MQKAIYALKAGSFQYDTPSECSCIFIFNINILAKFKKYSSTALPVEEAASNAITTNSRKFFFFISPAPF